MRFRRQGDYAVRVMLDLAAQASAMPVRRADIQARQDVPAAYLAKIVQALVRAGLVRTHPGARGGVTPTRPPEAITLRQVVEAVRGPLRLNGCAERPGAEPRDGFCPVQALWVRLQATLARELEVPIASLVRRGFGAGRSRPDPAPSQPGRSLR